MRLFNKVLQLEDPKKAFNLPGCVSMKLKSGSDLSDKSLRASFQVCRVFYVEALQGGALSLDETVVNHGDVAVVLFISPPEGSPVSSFASYLVFSFLSLDFKEWGKFGLLPPLVVARNQPWVVSAIQLSLANVFLEVLLKLIWLTVTPPNHSTHRSNHRPTIKQEHDRRADHLPRIGSAT
ncbi:hypothetical protein F2Q69_00061384 [Brassica cretica]|uniref:Uncharacterized protein n=1 Tax=Brassica cretica TaxID=69181 RepID=A0A8S9RDN7_BRACR|nr:hypothetical protein F2Q69_00061384 [Brassica cretica]